MPNVWFVWRRFDLEMPLGIVMASVSKSSTFIVSKNGQKLLELKTREVGDVQVGKITFLNPFLKRSDGF